MRKTKAIVIAICIVGGASSAMAAPLKHRSAPAHWSAGHHTWARTHTRAHAFEPHYAPYAYRFQPFSQTEERWFNQARGNIW